MKEIQKIFICFSLIFGIFSNAQSIDINEMEAKLKEEPKHLVIKFSTEWCGICKIQDRRIEKSEELKEILSERIYFIEFDAESTEGFRLGGKAFRSQPHGMHEFAEILLEGETIYPAWLILNSDLEIIFKYTGLLKSKELISIFTQIL